MTRVVINAQTLAQLHHLNQPLQFVDESGRPLGLFTPNVDPSLLKPQLDDAEIKRRLSQGGGRPLADILRDLEARS